MKIKVDYVTNSSSEVFGVVAGDTALVGGLMGLLIALFAGCKIQAQSNEINEPATQNVVEDASAMAQKIALGVLEDAKEQESIVKDSYDEAKGTLDSAKSALEKELDETNKTWLESEKTIDKKDPGYEAFKKQYDDYKEYLNDQIAKTEYQKQLVEYEKTKKIEEMESKTDWVKQQQADYIAVKEEKAMLEAVAKGYNQPGYNTSAVTDRLTQLNAREEELDKVLGANNATLDYTAKDRGSIGPSKESKDLTEKIRAEKDAYEKESKKATKEKKEALQTEMDKNISIYEEQMKKANRYDMATKAAEGIQYGADTAIDGLSNVTGPTGKNIKLAYTAAKGLASGMGEGMADPKNAAKHLAKGILTATTEVLKDKFGDDKPWQAAATGILNEGLQSGLDASIKGENVTDALGKGLTKGVFDAGIDKGLDKLKGALPIPKGSSVDVGGFGVGQILNNNPLTKGLLKTTVREAAGTQIKDGIKGAAVDAIGKEGGFADPE
jgi:hypothetical protein